MFLSDGSTGVYNIKRREQEHGVQKNRGDSHWGPSENSNKVWCTKAGEECIELRVCAITMETRKNGEFQQNMRNSRRYFSPLQAESSGQASRHFVSDRKLCRKPPKSVSFFAEFEKAKGVPLESCWHHARRRETTKLAPPACEYLRGDLE